MDFSYSDEQRQLRRAVREFAEAEIQPHVREWDEGSTFPAAVIKKCGEMGLMGSLFPESLGGAGYGYVEYALVVEELARVDPSVALIVAAHTSLCSNHLYLAGSDEQKKKYLPRLASGEWLGSWSLTEPEAGSDAGGVRATAVRDGEAWVLNGTKTFTTNAHYAQLCVVLASTDRSRSRHGISAFLVEAGTAGLRPGKKEDKLGMRASDTGEMILTECRVGPEALLGGAGEGFIDALRVLDGGRISIAALSLGIAQGAFDEALRYAQQRKQFGRIISEFQAIQFKLAEMATEIDAARLLVQRAAWMKDQGRDVNQASSMAKLYASEVAVRVCNEALQIHGGYGFTKDYPVEKFYRDVKLMTIGEGTSEIQKMVIARNLLKAP